jgi:peptide/nickel transport system permease protein
MSGYVVRRLLTGLVLLLSLTFVTYLVFYTIPTNPACLVVDCGPGNHTTPEELKAAEHQIGSDQPVLEQYGRFLWRIVSEGSLGRSFSGNQSVNEVIKQTFPVTASLVLGGAVLLLLLAVPLAIVAARRPRSFADRGLLAVALIGIAVHPFVLGIGLRSIFGRQLGLAPRDGYCTLLASSQCDGPAQWAYHLYLPWITFALFFLPLYMRMIRARLLETMGEQYVVAARAKGASETRVLRSHVLRNAMPPVLAMVAVDAGTAITAAIYIETIYGLPGLGHEAVSALTGQGGYDLPVVVGIVLTIALAVVVLNTAADLAVAWLDPRVRLQSGTGLIRLPAPLQRAGSRIPRKVLWATAAVAAAAVGTLIGWRASHGSGPAPAVAPSSLLAGPVQSVPAGWTETKVLPGGRMIFRVRSIRAGRSGWLVRGSVENRSRRTFEIEKGFGSPTAAGFSVLVPGALGLRVFSATAVRPEVPVTLAPGGVWAGSFAGTGRLPRGTLMWVGFGYFLPAGAAGPSQGQVSPGDPGFNWFTTNSFRLAG